MDPERLDRIDGHPTRTLRANGREYHDDRGNNRDDRRILDHRTSGPATHQPTPPSTGPIWRASSRPITVTTRMSTAGTINMATTSCIFGAA